MRDPLTPTLNVLGGAHAPPDLAGDLATLLTLPEAARDNFWELLAPNLSDPVPARAEAQANVFSSAFGASSDDLARAVRACRFLLREAASLDVGRAAFAADLAALSSDADGVGAILLPRFDEARAAVRREMMRRTIADHGKMLESVTWRVDTLSSSSRGKHLGGQVVSLTFAYREGDEHKRVTLQALPETLRELQKLCEQIATSPG